MISAAVFDIDQTLWDFHAHRERGLRACLELIADRATSPDASSWTIDDLQARFDALEALADGTALSEVRRRSLADAARAAAPGDPTLAAELHDRYFAHRHAPADPFPDVVPALEALRAAGLALAVVSNGNSRLDRLGLDGWFDDVVLGHHHGLAKPDPAIYELVEHRLGRSPTELVCIGDDIDKDVVGPMARGWRGVWNRRGDAEVPVGITPDGVVAVLTDLPDLLARW